MESRPEELTCIKASKIRALGTPYLPIQDEPIFIQTDSNLCLSLYAIHALTFVAEAWLICLMKMPIEKLMMSLIVVRLPFYSACNFGKTGHVFRPKKCCFFCISVSETGWLFGSKQVDTVTHYQQGNQLQNNIVFGIQLEWGLFPVTKRHSI